MLMVTTAKNAKYAKNVARDEGSLKQMFFAYLAFFAVVNIAYQSFSLGSFPKKGIPTRRRRPGSLH